MSYVKLHTTRRPDIGCTLVNYDDARIGTDGSLPILAHVYGHQQTTYARLFAAAPAAHEALILAVAGLRKLYNLTGDKTDQLNLKRAQEALDLMTQ